MNAQFCTWLTDDCGRLGAYQSRFRFYRWHHKRIWNIADRGNDFSLALACPVNIFGGISDAYKI